MTQRLHPSSSPICRHQHQQPQQPPPPPRPAGRTVNISLRRAASSPARRRRRLRDFARPAAVVVINSLSMTLFNPLGGFAQSLVLALGSFRRKSALRYTYGDSDVILFRIYAS